MKIEEGTQSGKILEIAKHGKPICLATITSGAVDIPTVSPPIKRINLYSAGVSKHGPVTATYTPL